MRNEPCKKCGNLDWYQRGNFSYCRFCHNEATKRYQANKRMGISYSSKNPAPSKKLTQLLKSKGSHQSAKTHCPSNHPYSAENTRIEEQRPGVIRRKCRACERAAKRVIYGLPPEPQPTKLKDLLDRAE